MTTRQLAAIDIAALAVLATMLASALSGHAGAAGITTATPGAIKTVIAYRTQYPSSYATRVAARTPTLTPTSTVTLTPTATPAAPGGSVWTITNPWPTTLSVQQVFTDASGDDISIFSALAPMSTTTFDADQIAAIPAGFRGSVSIYSNQAITAQLVQ